jgi:ATP-dependent helicase/nuclease subunit B
MPRLVPAYSGTYRDITSALARRILRERAGEADLLELLRSPVEILIPSRGVAEGIVAAMAAAFPQGVAGIRLQTIDTLALRILNSSHRYPCVAGEADRRLAMFTAASQIRDPRLNTPGIAVMLERSYRDIRDSGVTLSMFRRNRQHFMDPARSAELADCWRRYESLLGRAGSIDPADLLHQAVELLGPDTAVGAQIVFGFYDMTGLQEIFLQALQRAGKIDSLYLPVQLAAGAPAPPYSFARRYLQQVEKIASSPQPTGAAPRLAPWSVRRHATAADEARETCRAVRALIDRGADPRRIGMVARTIGPTLEASLERWAAEFGFTLSRSPGRALASHPFGRALRLLLQVRELRFPRAAIIEIASAPLRRDFWGFSFQAERLDSATRQAEIAGGASSWVKTSLARIETDHRYQLEQVTNYIRILDRIERVTEPLATERRGGRWAETIETFCDAFVLETEEDLQALESMRELAAVCRRAEAASFDARAVLHLLENADQLRQRAHEPKTVWFGDVMKARGRTFDHLFVLDLCDTSFPQMRAEDPLVSNAERRVSGVREIGDGRDEERLLFQLLLDAAADGIHFSYPATDGIRRVFNASPFLKEVVRCEEPDDSLRQLSIRNFSQYLARKNVAAESEAPRSRTEAKVERFRREDWNSPSRLLRKLELTRQSGTRSTYDGYIDMAGPLQSILDQKLELISPTQLEYYGQCPQRFLFSTLLGVGEIEDPDYELQISLRKKGGLDHKIMESFYRSLTENDYRSFEISAGALPQPLQRRLDVTIAEEFRRHDADFPAPNQMIREIEQKLTRKFLSDFVRDDLRDLAASGFRPIHFEYQFGKGRGDTQPDHEAVPLGFGPRTLRLRGKMDRVDRNPSSGSYRVVDYKSGKGHRYKDVSRQIADGRALQLGFYALAACVIFGVGPDRMQAAIKPLRRGEADERFSVALADIYEPLIETLRQLGDSLAAGEFPAFPGKHCDYCAVRNWCRSRHDPAEKHALGRYGSALQVLQRATAAAIDNQEPA